MSFSILWDSRSWEVTHLAQGHVVSWWVQSEAWPWRDKVFQVQVCVPGLPCAHTHTGEVLV